MAMLGLVRGRLGLLSQRKVYGPIVDYNGPILLGFEWIEYYLVW
jgi:hypothetical protein